MDIKKVGNFTFSHIGNGLYKADAPCVCTDINQFEGLDGGGNLLVLCLQQNSGLSIEVICDIHDDPACKALHRYKDDNYVAHGVACNMAATQDLDSMPFLGGLYTC